MQLIWEEHKNTQNADNLIDSAAKCQVNFEAESTDYS
jgi:hypothetical protein